MKRFYLIITCQILAIILFLDSHYLTSIYYYSKDYSIYYLIDTTLFAAIFLQILSILLLISLEVNKE